MWREGDLPPVAEWMAHRLRLFSSFTLPSIAAQKCQSFTWLVLMDVKTPNYYKDIIESIPLRNMECVYLGCRGMANDAIAKGIIDHIPNDRYDLITTEVDSDDAIHEDFIGIVQNKYRHREGIGQVSFTQGVVLDTTTGNAYLMKYPFHCPTVIENRENAKSIYCWQNSEIPADWVERIENKPYWLQVVHSHNVFNDMETAGSRRIIKDRPIALSALGKFNIGNLI
jgi:hypothetical protein